MIAYADPVLHWTAVVFYAISALCYIYGLAFSKGKWLHRGFITVVIGVGLHTAAVGVRWAVSNHPPILTRYENMSAYVLLSVYMFLLLQYFKPKLRLLGIFVMPVSLVTLGIALTSPSAPREVPATFNIIWSIVHIVFAQASFGAALMGSSLAMLFLLKKRAIRHGKINTQLDRLPPIEELDNLSYRFNGFAFLTVGIMVASGAVWANFAWGSYWSWDPIENWSLITWLFYGVYLHLRKVHGWSGTKPAWLSFIGLLLVVFILIGIILIYNSTHWTYFN
jgi:cytochrome c-type biogenesis protein CcsB